MMGGFPGGPVAKNLTANTLDIGLIPGLEWSHMQKGKEKPLQGEACTRQQRVTQLAVTRESPKRSNKHPGQP